MITTITYLFFMYLILALFIERSVEVLVSVFYYADHQLGWNKYWNRKAESHRIRLDKLSGYQGTTGSAFDKMISWLYWDVVAEKPYTGGKSIISASSIRSKYVRLGSRILAFLLALVFACFVYLNFEVDLITVFEQTANTQLVRLGPGMKVFLTAVLLSAGSEPLHQLITRVEALGKGSASKNAAK